MDPSSARAIRDAVRRGDVSATEVVRAALDRVEQTDAGLHAFHTVTAEQALERAAELDRRRAELAELPLLGVPVAIKDNICTRGVKTTAGSGILRDYVSPYDATVVERLTAAGAVIVGKTNCDEFAMGSSTENSAFGITRNPWAPDRIPGGSSGGSAVAVAARQVPLALGSDTGGSIRQPAAMCGVVGLKPTYGTVSRYGLLAFASSLDQIGPIAGNVEDAAIVLDVIAGHDPRDSTSHRGPSKFGPYDAAVATSHGGPSKLGPYDAAVGAGRAPPDLRRLRVGVPRALMVEGVDREVLAALESSIARMVALGATVVDIDLPHSRYAIPVYYIIATAEASSNLARYDGVRYGFRAHADALGEMYDRTREEGFGAEVKRRIMLGTYVLSAGYHDAYYLKAQQVRTLIRRDYDAAFERVDVIAMPTSPVPAFPLGERTADPIQMYLADIFTVGANLAGLPGVSIPCGLTGSGLPIGLQLTGRMLDESTILRAAAALERVLPAIGAPPRSAS